MDVFCSNLALYVSRGDRKVNGPYWTYGEDILHASTKKVCETSRKTSKTFELADDKELSGCFTDFVISQKRNETIISHQNNYLKIDVATSGHNFLPHGFQENKPAPTGS